MKNNLTNFYITGLFLNPNSDDNTSNDFFINIDNSFKKLLKDSDFFQKTNKHMIYVFCVFYDEWVGDVPSDLTDLVSFFDKPSIEITLYFDNASELKEIGEENLKIKILNKLFPRMLNIYSYFNLDEKPLIQLIQDFRDSLNAK